ncbi:MAG TPA: DCC1-like thiol-disulfide oxidoreductase family protein [Flavobacteriales bacterium]|nr:DCC1-like thiol-disulfide oxidoreductase family protein [Flavobacteriales bacterium]
MIVLFDGDCNFCNYSVQFIYKRDKKGVFRFASLQSPKGKELLEKHGLQNLSLSSMVLIKNEKAYIKSGAALRICGHLSGLWPLMICFLIVPPFIRNWVYHQVAKRRKRLIKDKCEIPTGDFKARFID